MYKENRVLQMCLRPQLFASFPPPVPVDSFQVCPWMPPVGQLISPWQPGFGKRGTTFITSESGLSSAKEQAGFFLPVPVANFLGESFLKEGFLASPLAVQAWAWQRALLIQTSSRGGSPNLPWIWLASFLFLFLNLYLRNSGFPFP